MGHGGRECRAPQSLSATPRCQESLVKCIVVVSMTKWVVGHVVSEKCPVTLISTVRSARAVEAISLNPYIPAWEFDVFVVLSSRRCLCVAFHHACAT